MEAENTLSWSLLTYPGVQVSQKLAHSSKLLPPPKGRYGSFLQLRPWNGMFGCASALSR